VTENRSTSHPDASNVIEESDRGGQGVRRTRIVCTLGPSTDKPGVLEGMIKAGMDVARINMSHGTHEEHAVESTKSGKQQRLLANM